MLAAALGWPMLRAMILEFPDDPACRYLDTQYMLGPALLVAPLFRPDGQSSYYLPDGEWRHLLSGEIAQWPVNALREIKRTLRMHHLGPIDAAIKAEQAAQELYTGLAEATDDPNLAAVFMALASEEAKHKHRFEVEYEENVLEGV